MAPSQPRRPLPEAARRIAPLLAVAWLAGSIPAAAAPVHWSYTGPTGPRHWGEHFPSCSLGRAQSPIDLAGPFERISAPLAVSYARGPLRILDNGHTIQVNVAPGSSFAVGGERYELVQFHFHRPSEETLAGHARPMVVHFVHKNAAGELAVLAVLVDEGAENPLVRTLWAHLPEQAGREEITLALSIDPAQLLPANRAYFRYRGSLTTPPCTEGVLFYILKQPVEMSRAQIEAFPYKLNARPVQPRNGRPIAESDR